MGVGQGEEHVDRAWSTHRVNRHTALMNLFRLCQRREPRLWSLPLMQNAEPHDRSARSLRHAQITFLSATDDSLTRVADNLHRTAIVSSQYLYQRSHLLFGRDTAWHRPAVCSDMTGIMIESDAKGARRHAFLHKHPHALNLLRLGGAFAGLWPHHKLSNRAVSHEHSDVQP